MNERAGPDANLLVTQESSRIVRITFAGERTRVEGREFPPVEGRLL